MPKATIARHDWGDSRESCLTDSSHLTARPIRTLNQEPIHPVSHPNLSRNMSATVELRFVSQAQIDRVLWFHQAPRFLQADPRRKNALCPACVYQNWCTPVHRQRFKRTPLCATPQNGSWRPGWSRCRSWMRPVDSSAWSSRRRW